MSVVVSVFDHEKLAPKLNVANATGSPNEELICALMVKVSSTAVASERAYAQVPSMLQVTVSEFLKGVPLNRRLCDFSQ